MRAPALMFHVRLRNNVSVLTSHRSNYWFLSVRPSRHYKSQSSVAPSRRCKTHYLLTHSLQEEFEREGNKESTEILTMGRKLRAKLRKRWKDDFENSKRIKSPKPRGQDEQ
jgi:hypothetical protein